GRRSIPSPRRRSEAEPGRGRLRAGRRPRTAAAPPARGWGRPSPPRLFDDDLALHEGVNLAVEGEGALLVELDRLRRPRGDVPGVEAASGRGVGGALGRIGKADAGAALYVQRSGLEG